MQADEDAIEKLALNFFQDDGVRKHMCSGFDRDIENPILYQLQILDESKKAFVSNSSQLQYSLY